MICRYCRREWQPLSLVRKKKYCSAICRIHAKYELRKRNRLIRVQKMSHELDRL